MRISDVTARWRRHRRALLCGRFNRGRCPVCRHTTLFVRHGPWLRDEYFCLRCESIPRQRALLWTLDVALPDWPALALHESSPAGASSWAIGQRSIHYASSHFWTDVAPGALRDGVRCENLESLTLPHASVDLFVTQDVFEHVLHPDRAFAEVARVLRPGGAHVFTVPLYPRARTLVRAVADGERIRHLESPDYHGNPIDPNGSLVIREWGHDLADYIHAHSALATTVYLHRDRALGLAGEFLEVLVSRKPMHQVSGSAG